MTILGCAHPQYGAFAQIGFPILLLAYRIRNTISKQNNTALFRKRSANKYKGAKYCFFYYFTFDYSIEMDQNNLAIILNYYKFTLLQNRLLRNTKIFLCPKNGLHIIKQDYILGDGDFLAF